jgi:hypothetical protein
MVRSWLDPCIPAREKVRREAEEKCCCWILSVSGEFFFDGSGKEIETRERGI